jgi:hypothetical protein
MALAHNPSIVRNGLVLHLDAANPKSYPGSGTVWTDMSGNDNNFTMIGNLSYSSGTFISTASTANYFIRNPFNHPTNLLTVEMWCRANTGSSADGLWSYAISAADNNHQLLYDQSNLSIYSPNNTIASSGINIANNTWRQIVRTSNRTTGAELLYLNGVSSFSATSAPGINFIPGGSLILAQEQDDVAGGLDANQAFEGSYSIFRIYNRVLSLQEISQNFEATRGRYGL